MVALLFYNALYRITYRLPNVSWIVAVDILLKMCCKTGEQPWYCLKNNPSIIHAILTLTLFTISSYYHHQRSGFIQQRADIGRMPEFCADIDGDASKLPDADKICRDDRTETTTLAECIRQCTVSDALCIPTPAPHPHRNRCTYAGLLPDANKIHGDDGTETATIAEYKCCHM